jgi:hypothetical protein
MTSDDTRRGADRPWRQVGVGTVARFRCGDCDRPSSTLGRKLKMVRGLRTWVCKGCAEGKA